MKDRGKAFNNIKEFITTLFENKFETEKHSMK